MSKSHRSDDLWARPGEVSRSLFNKQMKNNSQAKVQDMEVQGVIGKQQVVWND